MYRRTILTAVLIFTQTSWSMSHLASVRTPQQLTMASHCLECANSGKTAMDALKRFTIEMNAITDGALDIEIISDKMNYSDKCENFVGDGEVNKWGEVVQKELSKDKYGALLKQGPKDIGLYCPNFSGMNMDERKSLNILILTAMAHYESSCNFREKAPGPNGTAAGLLQLHRGKEGQYSSGCRNGDSASAERTLICGLSMLNDQVVARGERLFSSASYWEVLRPRGRSQKAKKIMAAINKFSACYKKSATVIGSKKNNAAARIAQK